ncbi:MAG: phosphoribosylglycinamide formyltransferase [Actinomycetota bacterium]
MEPSPIRHPRLVVLVSGSGSNLQALLDATADGRLPAGVVAVVSNQADALGLERAADAGVDAAVLECDAGRERADYDAELAELVASYEPDWIVLAGWMRLLSMSFLGRFPARVVNLHPALPGELPGTRAIERAWDEALAGTRTESGVMVHLVPDEGVDDGPVLATATVPIDTSAGFDRFAAAVHCAEHDLLVRTVADLCGEGTPIDRTPTDGRTSSDDLTPIR